MPPEILKIAKRHMRDPLKIAINVKDIVAPKIKQVFYEVLERDKAEVLRRLLDVESPERTLIFCHTKREVDDVSARLQKLGYNAGALHGDFTQSHREDMMGKFKEGRVDILVATDVAGRGIDVENISHVINYSIPQNPEGYIHRIGRTGRAGRAGIAVTFVTPREYRQLQLIERVAKTKLNRQEIPSAAEVRKARQGQIKADLSEVIEKGKHRTYMAVIRELAESADIEELGAAALSLAFGSMEVPELMKHQPRPASERRTGQQGTGEKGMTRLFMTLGHKDKIQTAEILKAIAVEAGIPGKSVGKIDIMDNFTFFEVPSEIVEKVITAMNRAVIRGRKVTVTKAKATSSKSFPKKKKEAVLNFKDIANGAEWSNPDRVSGWSRNNGHSIIMKNANLQTRLYLITAVILLAGLGSAILIYLRAGDDSQGVLGYEAAGGHVYPVSPEDSKMYMHDLELYGGKVNVLAISSCVGLPGYGMGNHSHSR